MDYGEGQFSSSPEPGPVFAEDGLREPPGGEPFGLLEDG